MLVEDMTMAEFEAGLEKTRTVLVPFGATEEHGDHLPLSTDSLIASEVGRKLALRRPLFVAPTVPYGVCRSTSDHPGTVTISISTLRSLALDILDSLSRQGLRNFVLLTGHVGAGQVSALVDAGEEMMRHRDDIRVAVLTEYMLASEEGRGIFETEGDTHAGEIETSRVLHSHPHLVRGEGKREFPSFPTGILVRDKRRCWPGGVWGDPTAASAEKGRRLEDLVVEELEKLVGELEKGE